MAPSSSFLLLFLLSSVMLMMLAAAAADGQGEEQEPACPTVPCGGVNIRFPFAIVTDEAREISCGLIGFQVMCLNSTPYLGYKNRFYGNQFQILDIFYHNASLLIADVHKVKDFNSPDSERCHAPKDNSSNKLGLPFYVSPINRQSLIFYNCMEPPLPEKAWRREGLVEMPCGNKTFARVAERTAVESSGSYGGYFLEGCNATVVPALARYGEANASDYRELISEGFLLTWQVPSTPPSSGTPHGPS